MSSRHFGPPKGFYKNLRHFSRDPASHGALELIPLWKRKSMRRELPATNSKRVTAKFTGREHFKIFDASVGVLRNGRVWGKGDGVVISPNDRLIWDLSPVNYTFRLGLHHVFTTWKMPRVRRYGKVVNLITRGADTNFGHWVHDLLPRFDLLDRSGVDLAGAYYLINHRNLPFQIQSLKMRGIPMDMVIMATDDVHVEAEELILPSLLNPNMNTDGVSYAPQSFEFLQKLFLGHPAFQQAGAKGRRIFISREKSRRKIRNEAELFGVLSAYGYEKVRLEELSLGEQALLFSSAESVVGFHGAGLTNLVFCRPGTQVIEIFSPDFIVTNFWTFSAQLGLRYHCYCEDERYMGIEGGRFQREVEQAVSLPDFTRFFKRVQHSAPVASDAAETEAVVGIMEAGVAHPRM